jgi:hypothetical protein
MASFNVNPWLTCPLCGVADSKNAMGTGLTGFLGSARMSLACEIPIGRGTSMTLVESGWLRNWTSRMAAQIGPR